MTRTKGTDFLDFIIRKDDKLVVVIQPGELFTDEQVKSIRETDFTKTEKEEEEDQAEDESREDENREDENREDEKQERSGVL